MPRGPRPTPRHASARRIRAGTSPVMVPTLAGSSPEAIGRHDACSVRPVAPDHGDPRGPVGLLGAAVTGEVWGGLRVGPWKGRSRRSLACTFVVRCLRGARTRGTVGKKGEDNQRGASHDPGGNNEREIHA